MKRLLIEGLSGATETFYSSFESSRRAWNDIILRFLNFGPGFEKIDLEKYIRRRRVNELIERLATATETCYISLDSPDCAAHGQIL